MLCINMFEESKIHTQKFIIVKTKIRISKYNLPKKY